MDIAARAQSIILQRQGSVSLHLSMAGYPGNATFLDARVQQTWDPEDLSSRKSLPKGLRTPDPESSQPSYPSPVTPAEPAVPDSVLSFSCTCSGSFYALPPNSWLYPSLPSPDSLILMEQPHPSSLYGSLAPLIWEATGDVAPFMVYVPFSTSDLYNWKHQNLSFSDKPQV